MFFHGLKKLISKAISNSQNDLEIKKISDILTFTNIYVINLFAKNFYLCIKYLLFY